MWIQKHVPPKGTSTTCVKTFGFYNCFGIIFFTCARIMQEPRLMHQCCHGLSNHAHCMLFELVQDNAFSVLGLCLCTKAVIMMCPLHGNICKRSVLNCSLLSTACLVCFSAYTLALFSLLLSFSSLWPLPQPFHRSIYIKLACA